MHYNLNRDVISYAFHSEYVSDMVLCQTDLIVTLLLVWVHEAGY